ncbi:SERTA domain-containing protein 3 [Hemibagrus wyckioides]|uniref:SERTA domain-containing protein 3 n=1 Tax=Hemibagrus wyckioides TaxID=337641 RepID=UPI00266DB2D8|nr:SERTA domain-containing protein 3 [Hemibagrus wyckioides]XP_058243093.1 SERTA domain-containing protein 3 [Hemibagrus wyckioides]
MVARGLKRKLHDHARDPGWENQLQSVLNISIDKYQRDQALVEPSLRRSVLITNTLRQAKTHMEAVSEIENPLKKIQTHHSATCFRQELGTPPGFEDTDDDFMEDLSLSTTITTILKNLDTTLDGSSGSSAPQRSPLASVENLTGDRTCKRSLNKSLSDHLQDSVLDDLLLDFDTSVCDREMTDHNFDISANEFLKYLPCVPCLGTEMGFLHSM